jgi:hypothetical protein
MRALLITQQGIEEVQLETVDGNQLDSMYRLIDCRTVTGAGGPNGTHVCYADDEALFTLFNGSQVNIVSWYPEKLVGKLLITGFDPKTGDTTPATMSVEELESMIKVGAMYYG